MGIFGYMERILDIIFPLHGPTYPADRRILVGTYIYNVIITLILHRTGSIKLLQSIISRHKVLARSGFIAQRPDNNRRIVNIGTHHFHHTCHVRIFPFHRMREGGSTIIIFVRFYIRLIFEINTVFVAQEIPIRIIRIM